MNASTGLDHGSICVKSQATNARSRPEKAGQKRRIHFAFAPKSICLYCCLSFDVNSKSKLGHLIVGHRCKTNFVVFFFTSLKNTFLYSS